MAAMGEKKELKKNTSTTVFLNKKEKKKTTIIPIQSFPPPSTKKKNLHKTKPQLNIKPLYLCFHYERTKNILPNFSNSFE
jgi:hypothetical protein